MDLLIELLWEMLVELLVLLLLFLNIPLWTPLSVCCGGETTRGRGMLLVILFWLPPFLSTLSSESDRFLEKCCKGCFFSWNSLICSMGPCKYLCLDEIRSLDALLVLSALGQALLVMKGLFRPDLMSSLGGGGAEEGGAAATRQKLDPAATIFSLAVSGERCRRGLELADL